MSVLEQIFRKSVLCNRARRNDDVAFKRGNGWPHTPGQQKSSAAYNAKYVVPAPASADGEMRTRWKIDGNN